MGEEAEPGDGTSKYGACSDGSRPYDQKIAYLSCAGSAWISTASSAAVSSLSWKALIEVFRQRLPSLLPAYPMSKGQNGTVW